MRNAGEYRRSRELLKSELRARHEAAPNEYLSETLLSPGEGQDQDALARYGSPLPDDVKEAVLFGRAVALHTTARKQKRRNGMLVIAERGCSTAPAAREAVGTQKKAQSTRFNSVPPLDDMRAVRRQLREGVGKRFPRFSTKQERDIASIGYTLDNISKARKQRSRNGRPPLTDRLKDAFDTLNAAGIPLRVGNKYISKAERHLMNTLGYTASKARGAVRRLRDLGSRI